MIKRELLFFFIILVAAFILRLYRFDSPIADWHAWRQADTSAVSRNFVLYGIDIFHPRFDDISNVASGKDNPEGYRFVEFPIYNAIQVGFFTLFSFLTLEQWGRLVSITASLLSMTFLYMLVKKYVNKTCALFAAVFYAVIPYNIYYGRVILPDPAMVSATLGGIYFFDKWIEKSIKYQVSSIKYWIYFVYSVLFTASAFLLKPYAVFFTLPMIFLAYREWGLRFFIKPQLWLFTILSITPLIAWRLWILQYPEGIPANEWLLNGNAIRFRPAFFRWIFFERITKLISGYFGIIILVVGCYNAFGLKERGFIFSFLIASFLYIIVFATGNVQHDYYQILIMPTLSIFFGVGAGYLFGKISRTVSFGKVILTFILFAMLYVGWGGVKDYFNINNPSIIAAGKAVDQFTPKDALVIAPNGGDTSFLYQTKRRGWASFEKPLPEMIAMGADFLILTNPTPNDFSGFGTMYKVVSASKEYMLLDLKMPL